MPVYLTQIELAERWKLSTRTLERWRSLKIGPPYVRIGGRIRYRLDDAEAFECSHRHLSAGAR